jgi:hypothetical protein
MQWEIGLCIYLGGPATKIKAPYSTAMAASLAALELNRMDGGNHWMWARVGEITRAPDCVEERVER